MADFKVVTDDDIIIPQGFQAVPDDDVVMPEGFQAVPDDDVVPPPEAIDNPSHGFWAAFGSALKSTPTTVGTGVKAMGYTSGITPLEKVGAWLEEKTKPTDETFQPSEFTEHPIDWTLEQFGQGLGSTLPSLVTGAAGAALGGLGGTAVAGPAGAAVGAPVGFVVGAASEAVPANIGDATSQFIQEGIDPDTSQKAGTWVGAAISVPDVLSAKVLTSPFRKAAIDVVVKTVAQRIRQGMTVEAATEGAQQMFQEAAAALLGGNATIGQRVENVVGSAIGGGFGGGVGEGGAHVLANMRPKPPAPPPGAPPADTPDAGAGGGTPPPGPARMAIEGDVPVGLKFGIKMDADKPPVAGIVEGVTKDHVVWRDANGDIQTDAKADFLRDVLHPPAPVPGKVDAITLPKEEIEPGTEPKVNEFNPDAAMDAKTMAAEKSKVTVVEHKPGVFYIERDGKTIGEASVVPDGDRGYAVSQMDLDKSVEGIATQVRAAAQAAIENRLQAPVKPMPGPLGPQASIPLADTAEIEKKKSDIRSWHASIQDAINLGQKTPEEIAVMRGMMDEDITALAALQAKLAAKGAGPEEQRPATRQPLAAMEAANKGPTGEPVLTPPRQPLSAMEAANKGPTGEPTLPAPRQPLASMEARTKGPTEAETGPKEYPVKAPEAPAQAGLAPVAGSEAEVGPNKFTPKAPPLKLAPTGGAPLLEEKPAPKRPTLGSMIKDRTAKLNDPQSIADATGLDVEDVKAKLNALAGQKDSPIVRVAGSVKIDKKTGQPVQSKRAGTLAYKGEKTGPVSFLEALSAAGGVRDDGGELTARNADRWHKNKPGKKKLINPNGIPLDQLGDWAVDNGFLPKRSVDETTDENYHADPAEALALMDKELAGKKQYGVGEEGPVSEGPEATPEEQEAYHKEQRVRLDLKDLGEEPSPLASYEDLLAQLEERLAMMGATSVDEAIQMINESNAAIDAMLTADEMAAVERGSQDGDFGRSAVEGEQEAGGVQESEPGPEPVAGVEGENDTTGTVPDTAEQVRGEGEGETPAFALTNTEAPKQKLRGTEKTSIGEQHVMPGMEKSAKQAQAAEQAKGTTKMEAKVAQEKPGGLLEEKPERDPNQTDIEEAPEINANVSIPPTSTMPGTMGARKELTPYLRKTFDGIKTLGESIDAALTWLAVWDAKNHTEAAISLDAKTGKLIMAETSNRSAAVSLNGLYDYHGSKSVVVFHNHPEDHANSEGGGGLSGPDMATLFLDRAAGIAAVAKDGIYHAQSGPVLRHWKKAHVPGSNNRYDLARSRFTGVVNDLMLAVFDIYKSARQNYIKKIAKDYASTVNPGDDIVTVLQNAPDLNRETMRWFTDATLLMNEMLHRLGVIELTTSAKPYGIARSLINMAAVASVEKQFGGYLKSIGAAPIGENNVGIDRTPNYSDDAGVLRHISETSESHAANAGSKGSGKVQQKSSSNSSGDQGTFGFRNQEHAGRDTSSSGKENLKSTSALARFISDEAGAVPMPSWASIKAFFNQVAGRVQTAAGIAARANQQRTPIGRAKTIQKLTMMGKWLRNSVSIASIDEVSARYWNALLRSIHTRNVLEHEGFAAATPYYKLDKLGKGRVHKILEYARLYNVNIPNTGRNVVVTMPTRPAPFGTAQLTLSTPGEIVALDAKETEAYHKLKEFFDQRLTQMGQAIAAERGYTGIFTQAEIQNAINTATSRGQRRAAQDALDIFNITEGMRRKGYSPLSRYGDVFIAVRKVAGIAGNQSPVEHYEFVDTKSMFDSLTGRAGGKPIGKVDARIAELRRKYPQGQWDITAGPVEPKTIEALNIPLLEKAFATLNASTHAQHAQVLDQILHEIYEGRKAGFRQAARNVSGYSTDFERAITDYVRQSSTVVSRYLHRRDIDTAYSAVEEHPSKDVRDYWKNHKDYIENGQSDFGNIRKLGFFMFLWGSMGSAATNLTQTPLVTTMQLATWAGPRAVTLAHGALGEAVNGITWSEHGITMDISKLGKTPGEKAMLEMLMKEGRIDPTMSKEAQGVDSTTNATMRPVTRRMQQVYDIGASMFNVAEQMNRVAAALAYYRASQNPQLRQKLASVYANDENFKAMVGQRMDPVDIARFGVDETQFIGGKANRMKLMRGPGSVLFQFKSYTANYLRLIIKNMTRMGWQGKLAASLMVGMIMMVSGLFGIPYGEDALKAADYIGEAITGVDPDLEFQFRQMMADSGMGAYGAEVIARGFGRNVLGTGVDMSGRLGMGNIFPDGSNALSFAPVLSGTIMKMVEANERNQSGQPIGALGALSNMLIGKGGSDLFKAFVTMPNEGQSTQKGNFVMRPTQLSMADKIVRSLGFQPSDITRKSEMTYHAERVANATQVARSRMAKSVARAIVLMTDAVNAGDTAEAARQRAIINNIFEQAAKTVSDPDLPSWQKATAPQKSAIKRLVMRMIAEDTAGIAKSSPKISRGDVLRVGETFVGADQ